MTLEAGLHPIIPITPFPHLRLSRESGNPSPARRANMTLEAGLYLIIPIIPITRITVQTLPSANARAIISLCTTRRAPPTFPPVGASLVGALPKLPQNRRPIRRQTASSGVHSRPKSSQNRPAMSHPPHTKQDKMEQFETIFRGLTRPGAPIDAAHGVCYQ